MTKKKLPRKLGLNKDTLRSLQGRELDAVVAGLMRITKISDCDTACLTHC